MTHVIAAACGTLEPNLEPWALDDNVRRQGQIGRRANIWSIALPTGVPANCRPGGCR
jgi:hypothetical protein